jgi:5-methylcytosine-specific restriction endonuclease McrA
MKRTPLKRKTPLKSKGNSLKKSPLNKISSRQRVELQERSKLKKELIAEYGNVCMSCKGKNTDWRGLTLSHIIPLSRGGLTVKSNTVIECYICHSEFEKHPEKRQNIYPYPIDIPIQ